MSRRNWVRLATTLSLLVSLTACLTTRSPEPLPARIVVTPSSFILTKAGESVQLRAQVLDDKGKVIEGIPVTWSSSDDGVAAVEDGLVTSVTDLGSVQVIATAEGVSSVPVLGILAKPAENATLIGDEHVSAKEAGTVLEPVDPTAEYGLGWQYRVTLQSIAPPQIGTVLLNTGELPIGGRVIEASQNGDLVTVMLEVVSPGELFQNLSISEVIPLDNAELRLEETLRQKAEVEKLADGSYQIEMRDLQIGFDALTPQQAATSFNLGPFQCKVEAQTFTPAMLGLAQGSIKVSFKPNLTFAFVYDDELKKLAVIGDPKVEVKVSPMLSTEFNGKIECNLALTSVKLPIGGPLSLLFGGNVPLGVGFELAAKTVVAQVGYQLILAAQAHIELGVDCSAQGSDGFECEMLDAFDINADAGGKPVLPDPTKQFRVELGAYAYLFAKLQIGNPFLETLQFETVTARLGLRQSFNLSSKEIQIGNSAYRSSYTLASLINVKTGSDVDKFLDLLKITAAKLDLKIETVLANSPKGDFVITPSKVKAGNDVDVGDLATFKVDLDNTSYLGLYQVDRVEFYGVQADGGLTLGAPNCTAVNAQTGQTSFSCQAEFREEHVGEQTYYAFLASTFLPSTVLLEVSADGKATVSVSEPADECPEVNALGIAQACEEPEEPFEIVSISYIDTVVSGAPTTEETTIITYKGDPVFPIEIIVRPRSCPANWTCESSTDRENNLPIDTDGFRCYGDIGEPVQVAYEIYLRSGVDSLNPDDIRVTAPYPTPFTCLPSK